MLTRVPKVLTLARQTAAAYGVRWLAARVAYEAALRTGVVARRHPRRGWDANELARWLAPGVPSDPEGYAAHRAAHPQPFFAGERELIAPALRNILGDAAIADLRERADRIADGTLSYFSGAGAKVFPEPGWHTNPFTGQWASADAHWTRIPVYSRAAGDIKYIWEPGRFSDAYVLARAYWATDEERFPEAFWAMAEDWCRQNPPNTGAHWKDGQEIAFRLMAWCFAFHAFAGSPATTPQRAATLVGAIAAQAQRIERGHAYARLQRNNHAISEGVGLWTVGLLFPELRDAKRWRERGRDILVAEAARQVAADGSYIQNSTNYHRVMLDDLQWAVSLGRACGEPLPGQVDDALGRAVDLLYQLQDGESGAAPNYGNNDGALVLPLSSCDYNDLRPVLAAGQWLAHGRRVYADGPWDEQALWLAGPDAVGAPSAVVERQSLAVRAGGYYTLRGTHGFGMIRCHAHHERPGHADLLHLDIWHNGMNVACDAGTYRYYDEPPWDGGLAATSVHNTVTVAGQDQMLRGPRFLWLEWANGRELAFERSAGGRIELFQGEHDGYQRLDPPVVHRRTVVRGGDTVWVIVDDLLGQGVQPAALHPPVALQWLLRPGAHVLDAGAAALALDAAGGSTVRWGCFGIADASVDLVLGDETTGTRGWRSPTYGVREPAPSLRIAGVAELPARFVTVFVLGQGAEVKLSQGAVGVRLDDGATLEVAVAAPLADATPIHAVLTSASAEPDQLTFGVP